MTTPKTVIYKGIKYTLFKPYLTDTDDPIVKITDPKDIDTAYALGFECVGYPEEIVKYLSEEEYNIILCLCSQTKMIIQKGKKKLSSGAELFYIGYDCGVRVCPFEVFTVVET